MSDIDPHIRAINVIFTSSLTTVTESSLIPLGSYLKIRILPTKSGKDIGGLNVYYSNTQDKNIKLSEEITEKDFFQDLSYCLEGKGNTFVDKATTYMRQLSQDDVSVIVKEYMKYVEDGVVLDGLITGIGAYIALLILNENGIFSNQMPFQFSIPYIVRNGSILNRNLFQHLTLPLISLSKVSKGVLLQLTLFVQSFINMWEPLFILGPTIPSTVEAKMSIDIISGFSQHIATSLSETRVSNEIMVQQLNTLEVRLQAHVDDAINKMRREINNLIIEARSSVKDLNTALSSQLNFVDTDVKDRINKISDKTLPDKIDSMVQMKIDASQDHIKDMVRQYVNEIKIYNLANDNIGIQALNKKLPPTESESYSIEKIQDNVTKSDIIATKFNNETYTSNHTEIINDKIQQYNRRFITNPPYPNNLYENTVTNIVSHTVSNSTPNIITNISSDTVSNSIPTTVSNTVPTTVSNTVPWMRSKWVSRKTNVFVASSNTNQ